MINIHLYYDIETLAHIFSESDTGLVDEIIHELFRAGEITESELEEILDMPKQRLKLVLEFLIGFGIVHYNTRKNSLRLDSSIIELIKTEQEYTNSRTCWTLYGQSIQ